jgi:hypothetical protein
MASRSSSRKKALNLILAYPPLRTSVKKAEQEIQDALLSTGNDCQLEFLHEEILQFFPRVKVKKSAAPKKEKHKKAKKRKKGSTTTAQASATAGPSNEKGTAQASATAGPSNENGTDREERSNVVPPAHELPRQSNILHGKLMQFIPGIIVNFGLYRQ